MPPCRSVWEGASAIQAQCSTAQHSRFAHARPCCTLQALARESGLRFFAIPPNALLSCFLGGSEDRVAALWSLAKKCQPCAIFLGAYTLGRASETLRPGRGAVASLLLAAG